MKAVLVPVSEAEVLHTRFGQMDYRPRLPEAPILNEFCSIGCVILCLFVCLSSDTLIHIYIPTKKYCQWYVSSFLSSWLWIKKKHTFFLNKNFKFKKKHRYVLFKKKKRWMATVGVDNYSDDKTKQVKT